MQSFFINNFSELKKKKQQTSGIQQELKSFPAFGIKSQLSLVIVKKMEVYGKRVGDELFIKVNWKELFALQKGHEIWIIFFMTSDQHFN